MGKNSITQIPGPAISRFLFSDTRASALWLLVRVYLGYIWITAGWEKINNPAWFGLTAGSALQGFLLGALKKTGGPHPDVSGWYGGFLSSFAIHHVTLLSNTVAVGELLVGLALILGIFTGIAAFFGAFMNMNYLLAGTLSINPIMFVLEIFLILAWRISGWIGIDRILLPKIGVPWHPGSLFNKSRR